MLAELATSTEQWHYLRSVAHTTIKLCFTPRQDKGEQPRRHTRQWWSL